MKWEDFKINSYDHPQYLWAVILSYFDSWNISSTYFIGIGVGMTIFEWHWGIGTLPGQRVCFRKNDAIYVIRIRSISSCENEVEA